MISSFDVQSLDNLLKDFYTVVGIRISVFDDGFNPVTEYPKTPPAFCAEIRRSEEALAACRKCDAEACRRAKKLREPHIYTCHAGITEAITPIAPGGGVLGYAILAHILPEEGYGEAVSAACSLAEKYGVPKARSIAAISGITRKSAEEIHSAVHILDATASYVYMKNLAKWRNDDISSSIDEYIKNNLSENLSSEEISKRFNFSRTSLYDISVNAFGMGIMKYVAYCRLERAKKLLLDGNTIAQTAIACGYGEYNYFCKVFKKSTGLSPTEFRKKHKNS